MHAGSDKLITKLVMLLVFETATATNDNNKKIKQMVLFRFYFHTVTQCISGNTVHSMQMIE